MNLGVRFGLTGRTVRPDLHRTGSCDRGTDRLRRTTEKPSSADCWELLPLDPRNGRGTGKKWESGVCASRKYAAAEIHHACTSRSARPVLMAGVNLKRACGSRLSWTGSVDFGPIRFRDLASGQCMASGMPETALGSFAGLAISGSSSPPDNLTAVIHRRGRRGSQRKASMGQAWVRKRRGSKSSEYFCPICGATLCELRCLRPRRRRNGPEHSVKV